MDVVILAGGSCDDALRQATGAEYRADIVLNGRTMLDHVAGCLEPLGRLVIVGGPSSNGRASLPSGDTFIQSLIRAVEAVEAERFLLATCDLPDLTTEAVSDFIDRCVRPASLYYPVVPMEHCQREYPGLKRTWLRLREGTFTGGNLALGDTAAMKRVIPALESAYAARKSPAQLASLVGWGTLVRVLLSRVCPYSLTIPSLERAVGRAVGLEVCAVVSPFASIGTDIDSADHLISYKALKIAR